MTSRHWSLRPLGACLRALCVAALVTTVLPSLARAASDTIVISQVYGGGGQTGAPYKNDFIELFNRGSVSVDVTGWTVQYETSLGSIWLSTDLDGSIPPGGSSLAPEDAGLPADGPTPPPPH